MPTLHIRIQPDRSPDLDLTAVLALFTSAAEVVDAELEILGVDDDECDDDDDDRDARFVRFDFRTLDVARLWTVLQGQVFWDDAVGPALAAASIVTCDGRHGGDDAILLLHHHDRAILPDTLDDV